MLVATSISSCKSNYVSFLIGLLHSDTTLIYLATPAENFGLLAKVYRTLVIYEFETFRVRFCDLHSPSLQDRRLNRCANNTYS